MTTSLIATTHLRDLQPLGTGGQSTIDSARVVFSILARELSPAHAALFAEPLLNPARGEVDWYGDGEGPAPSLADAPPEQRGVAEALLQQFSTDIQALAARMRLAARDSDRLLGELLELVLQVPSPDSVRVRAGRPILIGWGHKRAGAEAPFQPVRGMAQVTRPPPIAILPPPTAAVPAPIATLPQPTAAVPAPTAAVPPPMAILPPPYLPEQPARQLWPWLLALITGVALLVSAIWFAFNPSGIVGPLVCHLPNSELAALTDWSAADARNATLRSELAGLVNAAGRPCQPAAQQAQVLPSPPVSSSRDAHNAQQRGAHTGHLQIILAWDDRNDLDLHVICPNSEHLFFHNRLACGGELDVDANSVPASSTENPVENAVWAEPPPGRFGIIVDAYSMRVRPQSPFRVTIVQEGHPDRIVTGIAVAGQRMQLVTEVQVDAAPLTAPPEGHAP